MNLSRALRAMPSSSNTSSPVQQLLNDDDCCYRLRTLRITTEDRRTWEIYHWQYLAWGDHGKICPRGETTKTSVLKSVVSPLDEQ
jgi:hypothetical protein